MRGARRILGKFLTDFSAEELADYAAKAYADEKFGGADTAPVESLGRGRYALWRGPDLRVQGHGATDVAASVDRLARKTG